MKTRWVIIGLIALAMVFGAAPLEAQRNFQLQMPLSIIPNLGNTFWIGSGNIANFDATIPGSFVPIFNEYSMKIGITEQEMHLFGGLIQNEDCPGLLKLGGRFTGHVSNSGQVTLSLYVGCLCSESSSGGSPTYLSDTPPTHQFTGQLSGDRKVITGAMHSLAAKDLPTIAITFEKQ